MVPVHHEPMGKAGPNERLQIGGHPMGIALGLAHMET